jgi:hypothetical protein
MATRQRTRSGRPRRGPGGFLADRRRVVLSVVGVVVVLGAAFFAWDAYRAAQALQEAEDRAGVMQQDIVDGDVDAARRSLKLFDASTSRARESTDGPHWWLAAHVPLIGQNADAVQTVARELDEVSDDVLPGVVDVADKVRLETFRPKNGRMDLEAVASVGPVLANAAVVLEDGNQEVAAFDVDGLIGPLRRPMTNLQDRFNRAAGAASSANEAARLLPSMLATDGKRRTYLLLIMNNAEVRSLAGMPGSVAVLTAKNGRVKMREQGGIQDVRPLARPPKGTKLTKDEKGVFQSTVATDMRDTAIHPDFPRAAQLAAGVVGKRWDVKFDGAIGVDPVTLGYMLKGLGPVDVIPNVTLNNRNAVSTLLNGIYRTYPHSPAKQDAVFEKAARRIFNATVDGKGNSQGVIKALVRAVGERRLMVWSRDDTEQKRIETSGISGAIDTGSGRPQVGVYVNDNGSTKMEYYLGMSTTLQSETCLDDGSQELRTTTMLVSTAPLSAGQLPESVVGNGMYVKRGNMLLGVMVMGPRGGDIISMTVDGVRAPVGSTKLGDRPVAKVARELPPGQNSVIVTRMKTAAAGSGDPELRTTPGIAPLDETAEPSSCD